MTTRPILGVITTSVPSQNDPRSRASYTPKAVWCQLAKAAVEQGLTLCLFRPEDLLPTKGAVVGYVSVGGTWTRTQTPLPDIVYENVYVHLATKPDVRAARRFFRDRGTPLFNPRLGNKHELAEWIRQDRALWQHHPETELLVEAQQVFQMLERYERVYLKPLHGSSGQGILEIAPYHQQRFSVRAAKFSNTKQPLDVAMTRTELVRLIRRECKRRPFLLQQGVELIHIDKGKVDLRTHLQRNRRGKWEQVALVVKRGRPNSIVSNYHAGGSRHDWKWLEEAVRGERTRLPKLDEVFDLSERIARSYTEKAPRLAALGLDLGLDRQGKLWLLDVNARPGRNILDADQVARCAELHAEFAAYLLER
ncbi:YheC/YheD family protein [Tumebacillus permanentifrigoris]|uniref:YheC/D-like protein n=1 Tax=Tumebacillus permanentifrigoris TaxID=378543 RepID=A0A316D9J7_9BACL|nr:YheC/YheD family protein [Tumebacillus permanentifrigoris]PWK13855.1 YheC/D-like protein [Tumebacillus permanentifrigoris]